VPLKFAPKRFNIPSSQVLASEKPPKQCLEVHLKSTNTLKATGTEIFLGEKIKFHQEFVPLPTKKSKSLDYASFTLFPSGLNSRRSNM
jgi:hypothetical protein